MEPSEYISAVVKTCGSGRSLTEFIVFMAVWIALGLVLFKINSSRKINRYKQRYCTGRDWRRQFPSASKDDIRAFLHLFCDEFLLAEDSFMLKLKPADTIYNVAKSFEAHREYNFLELALESEYGINLENEPELHLNDVTLGELFAVTQKYVRLTSIEA